MTSWQRNGLELEAAAEWGGEREEGGAADLVINSVGPQHAGNYTCTVLTRLDRWIELSSNTVQHSSKYSV